MVSDIEFLEAVYERMQQVGLVQSKADFSARMLGKGPSYLTSMSARDRKVPDEVTTFLIDQLKRDILAAELTMMVLQEQLECDGHAQKQRTDLVDWIESRSQGGARTGDSKITQMKWWSKFLSRPFSRTLTRRTH